MKEYLSEQQRAQFERELAQDEGMLSEQQAQRAIGQGMEMAQADMQTQQQDGLPEKYGFGSIEEMAAQYERLQGTVSELKKMLSRLLDME